MKTVDIDQTCSESQHSIFHLSFLYTLTISLSILQIFIYQKQVNSSNMQDNQAIAELPPFAQSVQEARNQPYLHQNDYLQITKTMLNYLRSHISEYLKEVSEEQSKKALDKMKEMEKDKLFSEYRKIICTKQVRWENTEEDNLREKVQKDGKMLEMSMILEFIRQTFCSIFEIILNFSNVGQSNQETDIDFLQKEVKQAKQAINYYENTFVFKLPNFSYLNTDHQYETLIDMKNNYYSYEEQRQFFQLLQLKKKMEESFEFFRYPVLGIIPHYLRQLAKKQKHKSEEEEALERDLVNLIRNQFEENQKDEEMEVEMERTRQGVSIRDMRELMHELF